MTNALHRPTSRLTIPAALLCAALIGTSPVMAQTLTPSTDIEPVRSALVGKQMTADFIVAIVNSEPITNNDLRQRVKRAEQQMILRGVDVPGRDELAHQVLEQLVNERVQLQRARELGISADEAAITAAEQTAAEQNGISVEEMRKRASEQGITPSLLRQELRNQVVLQRVAEREANVSVSESDIDEFIRTKYGQGQDQELNLAHVLVLVPEEASAQRVNELQARAQEVADRARSGQDFANLAREYSDAPERIIGGVLGTRPSSQLPPLFVSSTLNTAVGGIAGPVRSPAGFHVLKVLQKRQPSRLLTQTHTSHILLRTGTQLSQSAAIEKLGKLREQITSGKATFAELAREHSQDGSAPEGGDLGWANPGQFVPEFEKVINRLRPGEISKPLVSRFGVHIVLVHDRREIPMTPRQQRDAVRELVREQKSASASKIWAQDLRNSAFVEYRQTPRP